MDDSATAGCDTPAESHHQVADWYRHAVMHAHIFDTQNDHVVRLHGVALCKRGPVVAHEGSQTRAAKSKQSVEFAPATTNARASGGAATESGSEMVPLLFPLPTCCYGRIIVMAGNVRVNFTFPSAAHRRGRPMPRSQRPCHVPDSLRFLSNCR